VDTSLGAVLKDMGLLRPAILLKLFGSE